MKKDKRVLLSLLIIAVTAVIAVSASVAFFTAKRTATTNKFTVGTLDLNVMGTSQVNEPFVLENLGAEGNISGEKTWTVKNTGTLPGKFLFRLQNLENQENACNDPEKEAEPNCEANNEGELGGKVTLKVSLDGVEKASSTLAADQVATIGEQWNTLPEFIFTANSEHTVKVEWSLDENDYGNEIQSDSLSFDANFRLIQKIAGPTVTN